MKHVLVESGVVVQTEQAKGPLRPGFIEAPDSVAPGFLYDGATFTAPPPSPAPAPQVITKLQAKRALQSMGKWGSFKAALNGADASIQEDFELAVELERTDPLIAQFGVALGLDDEALDNLFRTAAEL